MAHKDAPTVNQTQLLRNLCQKYNEPYPEVAFMSSGSVGKYIRKIQEKYNLLKKKIVTVITVYSDGSTKIETR
jgi:hypothetical protein